MELFVGGEKIDVTLEGEKTVGDVLRSFEISCEENGAAVTGIRVDGENVTAKSFDDVAKKELKESTKIELNVVTRQTITEGLKKLPPLFDSLALRMGQVPINLQSGKGKEAAATIAELANKIEFFCHIAALAALFPDMYEKLAVDGKSLTDFFAGFTPILSDFENALKSNDTVLVGDLAEYEICPRLRLAAKALSAFEAEQ